MLWATCTINMKEYACWERSLNDQIAYGDEIDKKNNIVDAKDYLGRVWKAKQK